MECAAARKQMLRNLDCELPESEQKILDAHLRRCLNCARDYKILSIPGKVAQTIIPLEPSRFFRQTLKVRIADETGIAANVQQFIGLAKRLIPSMAAITLALLTVFVYVHLNNPGNDLYAAYERAFMAEDVPVQIMLTERRDVTDASILSAIANRGSWQHSGSNYRQK